MAATLLLTLPAMRGLVDQAVEKTKPWILGALAKHGMELVNFRAEVKPRSLSVAILANRAGISVPMHFDSEFNFVAGKQMLEFSREGVEKVIAASLVAAKNKISADISARQIPAIHADLSKISVQRMGPWAVYGSAQFPLWTHRVSAAVASDPLQRSSIAAILLASLTEAIALNPGLKADFGDQVFQLPRVPDAVVKAAPVPVVIDAEMLRREDRIQALFKTGYLSRPALSRRELQAMDQKRDMQAKTEMLVYAPMHKHIESVLKGRGMRIQSVDASQMEIKGGYIQGTATLRAEWMSPDGHGVGEFSVPFTDKGAVQEKIGYTAAHLQAAKERELRLKILNEAQARRNFEAVVQKGEAGIPVLTAANRVTLQAEIGGMEAGSEYTPSERIPAFKSAFGADTKPGDKFEIRGWIYEVCKTTYQANGDVENGPYWMLALRKDILPGEFPAPPLM
jgi:hypothetical protein